MSELIIDVIAALDDLVAAGALDPGNSGAVALAAHELARMIGGRELAPDLAAAVLAQLAGPTPARIAA